MTRSLLVVCLLFFISIISPDWIFGVAYSIEVTNLPLEINVNNDQETDLHLNCQFSPNSDFYLRVSFFQTGTTNYFGYTEGYNGSMASSFYKVTTDDGGKWLGAIKVKPDRESSYFFGDGNYGIKVGYYTSLGSTVNWKYENTVHLIYTPPTNTPSPMATATPTSSPTPTPKPTSTISSTNTPTPTPATKATYKINDVRNSEGSVLSSVDIYVDGKYVHHYPPEELIFCSNCECYSGVACGLGEHTIRLEKNGYLFWSEKKDFTAGSSWTVDPVMTVETGPENIPTPTKTPTPSPTLKLTPTPSSQTTPSIRPTIIVTESGDLSIETALTPSVLGVTTEALPNKKPPVAAFGIISGGVVFLGLGAFSFLKGKK